MKTLEDLVKDAISTVESGFYDLSGIDSLDRKKIAAGTRSLTRAIRSASIMKKRAIICEIKFASPSAGEISTKHDQISVIASEMEAGGATALSVLTEPRSFNGSIDNLVTARRAVSLPVIMKDIIVSEEQIRAGAVAGANAVLLIEEVFSNNFGMKRLSLNDAVEFAREQGLEVIGESHSIGGLATISDSACDIIGINNRDLKTFKTSIETTLNLLTEAPPKLVSRLRSSHEKISRFLVSESGFENAGDILKLTQALRDGDLLVPDAFLIGTSIMRSGNIKTKVKEFVEC